MNDKKENIENDTGHDFDHYWFILMAFSTVVHTSDNWSMLIGKAIPFLTGLYIVHYVLTKYQK